jgi:hypothetical protein
MNKYELYGLFFQQPEEDVRFINELYTVHNNSHPKTLREDYSGAAANSLTWIRQSPEHSAIAVDIDPEPLEFCKSCLDAWSSSQIKLSDTSVLAGPRTSTDIIFSGNCSLFESKTRKQLLEYLRLCLQRLNQGGLFLTDIYCGPDALSLGRDHLEIDGMSATWEQSEVDQLTSIALSHVHFHLPENKIINRAFTYHHRIWTPVEIVEAIIEAGFSTVEIYKRNQKGAQPFRTLCSTLATDTSCTLDFVAYK